MSSTCDILVVAEHEGSEPRDSTLEVLGEARRLASRLRSCIAAVALGSGLQDLPATLAAHGADLVLLAESPSLEPYQTEPHVDVLASLIRARGPRLVLVADTPNGRDLAPRLAARLEADLVTGCTSVTADAEGNLQAVQPIYRQLQATVRFGMRPPAIATIRCGAIGLDHPQPGSRPEVELIPVDATDCVSRTRVLGVQEADPATVDLREADLVVAGGRGAGPRGWHLVESLAAAIGAAVGGTRVPMDQGCIPPARVIGQSGRFISPRLYVAAGISGASQHTTGVRDSRCIVSINRDRGAPVTRLADLALVGDLHEVLPQIIKLVREEKASGTQRSQGEADTT